MNQRQYDIKRQSGLYCYLPNDGRCVYCGEPEECQDHFLPISIACNLDDIFDCSSGKWLLPSCIDCNSIAGAKVFNSFQEKFDFIQDMIKSKTWNGNLTDEELTEYGYVLRTTFLREKQQNERNQRRIKWQIRNIVNVDVAEILFNPIERGRSFVPGNANKNFTQKNEKNYLNTQEKNSITGRKKKRLVDDEFYRNAKEQFGEEEARRMMNETDKY